MRSPDIPSVTEKIDAATRLLKGASVSAPGYSDATDDDEIWEWADWDEVDHAIHQIRKASDILDSLERRLIDKRHHFDTRELSERL